jgi:RHS repeat-associated protein
VWGLYIDELIQLRDDISSSPADYYPLQDLLYRTNALTDSSGAIVEKFDYDAYGNTLIFDAGDNPKTNPICEFLFTGRRFDPETQLYFYRARYYNPTLGRFMSRDPIGYQDGMGLYEYVKSSSFCKVDPYGLGVIDWIKKLWNKFNKLWKIYAEKIPDSDPGKKYAQALMRHYVFGLGRTFAEEWGDFMKNRPELKEAIRPVFERLTVSLCKNNKDGAKGKINETLTGVKLNELMSMRLTLHGCHKITITDDWKLYKPKVSGKCSCRVEFNHVKITWYDKGNLHPGTQTELNPGEWVDDSQFQGYGWSYPIKIHFYTWAKLEMDYKKGPSTLKWLGGWPGKGGISSGDGSGGRGGL